MKESNYFINGLITKNEKIIQEIYVTNFNNVLRFVLNNKGQRIDAEDVFQKVLLQIITRVQIQKFEIKYSFDAYFFSACKNLWRRELNKQKRIVTNNSLLEQANDNRDLALSILEQERWEFFNEKLENISLNCREVLKRFFNKIPYNQIVKELNYSSETVARQRVFKCKKKLIETIKNDSRFNELKEL